MFFKIKKVITVFLMCAILLGSKTPAMCIYEINNNIKILKSDESYNINISIRGEYQHIGEIPLRKIKCRIEECTDGLNYAIDVMSSFVRRANDTIGRGGISDVTNNILNGLIKKLNININEFNESFPELFLGEFYFMANNTWSILVGIFTYILFIKCFDEDDYYYYRDVLYSLAVLIKNLQVTVQEIF